MSKDWVKVPLLPIKMRVFHPSKRSSDLWTIIYFALIIALVIGIGIYKLSHL